MKSRWYVLALALALSLLAGCGWRESPEPRPVQEPPSPPLPPPPEVIPAPPEVPLDDMPQELAQVVMLTNHERSKEGRKALKPNPMLMRAAQKYAEKMAARDKLSHSIDGEVGGRIAAEGYRWRTCGENIAWNYQGAEAVMKGWMGSPGHRRNIMNPLYQEVGVGVARNSRGETYHCQVFGTATGSGPLQLLPGIGQRTDGPPSGPAAGGGGREYPSQPEWTTGSGTAASSVSIERR
jgi:uncharacterized protein YkwD